MPVLRDYFSQTFWTPIQFMRVMTALSASLMLACLVHLGVCADTRANSNSDSNSNSKPGSEKSPAELALIAKLLPALQLQKDYEVIDTANQILKIDPSCGEAFECKGLAEYNLQDSGRAIKDLQRAIKLGHPTCDGYIDLGECMIERRQFNDALHYFEAGLKIDPKRRYLLRQVGELYTSMHQYKNAEEYYLKALAISPRDADTLLSLGHCHYAQGEYQKAVDDYSKALEKNPADIRFYANRASAYKKLNQMDKYKADMLKSNQAAIDFVN